MGTVAVYLRVLLRSATTGLLDKVRYYHTGGYDEAEYTYDDVARLVQIDDWLGGNGLRYEYDAAGRMNVLTDYDDSELEYAYDANGNVTQMTDYHGNVTSYVYDDGNQLTSMTAPGSKTWGFYYNALGQPIIETLPNGMATTYAYDSRNRLETIQHKTSFLFGTTVNRVNRDGRHLFCTCAPSQYGLRSAQVRYSTVRHAGFATPHRATRNHPPGCFPRARTGARISDSFGKPR